jgi:hypothetical protein
MKKSFVILFLFISTACSAQVSHAFLVSSVTKGTADAREVEDYIFVCISKHKGLEYLEVKNETKDVSLRGQILATRVVNDVLRFTWRINGSDYKALLSVSPYDEVNIYVLSFTIGDTIYSYTGTEDITDLISLK